MRRPDNGIGTIHAATGDFTQHLTKIDGLMPEVIYAYHNDLHGDRGRTWRYRRRPGTAEYDYDPLPSHPDD